MRHSTPSRGLRGILVAITLGLCTVASAQDPRLDQLGKSNRHFGMDSSTFRRLLGAAFREGRLPAPTSATVEGMGDQVSEIRLFLTPRPNIVIGEIALAGRTRLSDITIPLEQGPVKFNDGGQPPDKVKGDGVFTAQFRMATDSAWQSIRRSLGASARIVRSTDERQLVRRGPRDIVPARDVLEALRTQAPATFRALTDSVGRTTRLADTPQLFEAAKVAGVDIVKTPVLIVPGPALDPRERFAFQRAFGIPILPVFPPPPPPVAIDATKSLMVVDPGVVDDPHRTFDACTGVGAKGGPWTFGHLMREMSHGTGMTPEDYTLQWLSSWILAQEANGFIVNEPARGMQLQTRIIDSWQRLSGSTLDVDQFPARLLAIVNRPDLADKIGYGVAGSAGEGRFVFGLLEKTAAGPCNSMRFTVIFEYGIKGGSCAAVKSWEQRWKNLDLNAVGSDPYNAALELITRDFTDHGSNPGQLPNESSLNQLRTNEIALGSPWQLREFRLQSNGSVPPGVLDLVTVKQTPDDGFRNGSVGTVTVAAFIIAKEADILADKHVVPERFPGIFNSFMGAKSNVDFPPNSVFWNAPGLTSPPMTDPVEARRKFSLKTCNGCHGGETNTFFTHIGDTGERTPGAAAALSGFLMGIDVCDPVKGCPPGGPPRHHYADLADREVAMSNILTNSCFALLGVRRIPFVH